MLALLVIIERGKGHQSASTHTHMHTHRVKEVVAIINLASIDQEGTEKYQQQCMEWQTGKNVLSVMLFLKIVFR